MITTKINIHNILQWGAAQVIPTKLGPRKVRKAKPDEQFWRLWKSHKNQLRGAGITVRPLDASNKNWEAHWYAPVVIEDMGEKIAASWADDADFHVPTPDGWDLMGFQKAGVQFVMARIKQGTYGSLIADSMGLGKTVQAVGVMNLLPTTTQILVICPASLKLNWQREIERWQTRDLPIRIVNGRNNWPDDLHGITIINYDLLSGYADELRATEWGLIVGDECHFISNPKAARSKALLGRKPSAVRTKHWLFLTGTPILNRPIDIQPVLATIEPGTFGNFWAFAKRYNGAAQGQFGFEMGQGTNLAELNDMLRSTCMVRRLKEDVLDLPPKRYQVIELPSSREIRMILDRELEIWKPAQDSIDALNKRVSEAAEQGDKEGLEKAIHALQHAETVAFDEMAAMRKKVAGLKSPLVVEHLKNTLDGGVDKVVVMCHHHETVLTLMEAFKAYDPVCLYGPMSLEARQQSVDRFQNEPGCRVFIGTIRAAGVGITLTAASHMVFAEQDWVHGWMDQAGDRCYRIGQGSTVLIQNLVMEGSLDAQMARTVARKMMTEQKALNARTGTQAHSVANTPTVVEIREDNRTVNAVTDTCRYEFTPADQSLLRRAMMVITSYDQDHARTLNGMGWSKIDSAFGHSLTGLLTPSAGQMLWQARLAWKYRRQLGRDIGEQVGELGHRIAAVNGPRTSR